MLHTRNGTGSRRAFTIVEILTVIAVIAILASILFPLVGKAQENAKKAKTRVQFSQWSSAIEGFRQEYGHYPNFTDFADGLIDDGTTTTQFVEALSGRTVAGARITLSSGNPGFDAGNKKAISFYSFGTGDLTADAAPELQDAFGNTEIVVLLDSNYDGQVVLGTVSGYTTDHASPPPVNSLTAPTDLVVRAGVVFYSAGAANSEADIIKSWQ